MPFFRKVVWCAQHVHFLTRATAPLMYIVCLNFIKLATHIQAHSEPCSELHTEMLQCMSTRANHSYAQGTYRLNCLHVLRFKTFWMIQEIKSVTKL